MSYNSEAILKLLKDNPDKKFTISEIRDCLNINQSTVSKAVKQLRYRKIIDSKLGSRYDKNMKRRMEGLEYFIGGLN